MTEPQEKKPHITIPRKVYMTPQVLKQARRWVGLTQAELAAKLGVKREQYAKWESEPRPAGMKKKYPKHRGISRLLAQELQRLILEHAQANGIDTAPLTKLFSPE